MIIDSYLLTVKYYFMKFTVSECFDVQLSESELNEICQDGENNIERTRISGPTVHNIARDNQRSLQTIHEKDFVHRDFHSGNILIEIIENNSCKIDQYLIGNLGLSRPSNDIPQDSNIYGVILRQFSKSSADIYGVGLIMWELITGCKPFANAVFILNSKDITIIKFKQIILLIALSQSSSS
ncbi:hypothetical protein RhiirA4_476930 [Rhizophagus irregularis]|uniref:Protein kinase domain-containing protein n=1 Tax=Rhizophagus irregularis TaxID=588596 RepID=A0A2I1HCC9_9GLOM|nr:hypothetical protein RhiirA4_476930 [Rhizophagus irregularis]